jgi:hypothetical protein
MNTMHTTTPGPLVEIGYDTGISSGILATGTTGYAVRYAPDCREFIIKRIKIYGELYGSEHAGKYAEFRIVDQHFRELYSSTFMYSIFNTGPKWVSIEVADVPVQGTFYVFLQTGSTKADGISIG